MKIVFVFDGGGARGNISSRVYQYMEHELREKEKRHVCLSDYIDVFGGTSTGGIQSIILNVPAGPHAKYDGDDLVSFYEKHSYSIFNKSKKINLLFGLHDAARYSVKNLTKYLRKYIGDVQLSDMRKHVVVPTLDLKSGEVVFFSNVKHEDIKTHVSAVDAALSTSAAPTYFPLHFIKNDYYDLACWDGGLSCNNTSLACATKLIKYDEITSKDMFIVNIGTGSIETNIDVNKKIGMLQIAKKVLPIAMHSLLGLTEYEAEQMLQENYFRIDVADEDKKYSSEMADASKKNMEAYEKAAFRTIAANREKIHTIIDYLIVNKNKQK